MTRSAKEINAMSEDELMDYTLSGESSSLGLGQAALVMRAVSNTRKANAEIADVTKELVQATRRLVRATWGVVIITLIMQAVLIYVTKTAPR
jgi:hypothetical protein